MESTGAKRHLFETSKPSFTSAFWFRDAWQKTQLTNMSCVSFITCVVIMFGWPSSACVLSIFTVFIHLVFNMFNISLDSGLFAQTPSNPKPESAFAAICRSVLRILLTAKRLPKPLRLCRLTICLKRNSPSYADTDRLRCNLPYPLNKTSPVKCRALSGLCSSFKIFTDQNWLFLGT